MPAFIDPPPQIPFPLKIGIRLADKITGKHLLAPRILAWYPKTAIGSGILESLVANGRKDLDKRLLKLVRIQASFAAACPFCIDMNSAEYQNCGVTQEELAALQGLAALDAVPTLSARDKAALAYTRQISASPLSFPPSLIQEIKALFTEREMVILASTAAQVNYWARLIQALGIPPAGFTESCTLQASALPPHNSGG